MAGGTEEGVRGSGIPPAAARLETASPFLNSSLSISNLWAISSTIPSHKDLIFKLIHSACLAVSSIYVEELPMPHGPQFRFAGRASPGGAEPAPSRLEVCPLQPLPRRNPEPHWPVLSTAHPSSLLPRKQLDASNGRKNRHVFHHVVSKHSRAESAPSCWVSTSTSTSPSPPFT